MVIHNFYVVDITFKPFKANTPLGIDTNTILPFSLTFKFLQMICRRYTDIVECNRTIEHT